MKTRHRVIRRKISSILNYYYSRLNNFNQGSHIATKNTKMWATCYRSVILKNWHSIMFEKK